VRIWGDFCCEVGKSSVKDLRERIVGSEAGGRRKFEWMVDSVGAIW